MKKYMLLMIFLLIAFKVFSQNYQNDFTEIIETYSSEGEDATHEALEEYFNELSDEQFVNAIVEISELGNDYETELTLKSFVLSNINLLEDLKNNNDINSKITFLISLKLIRTTSNENFKEYAINLLDDPDISVVLEAVKALHFILSYQEEKDIFNNLRNRNNSSDLYNLICEYIGVI